MRKMQKNTCFGSVFGSDTLNICHPLIKFVHPYLANKTCNSPLHINQYISIGIVGQLLHCIYLFVQESIEEMQINCIISVHMLSLCKYGKFWVPTPLHEFIQESIEGMQINHLSSVQTLSLYQFISMDIARYLLHCIYMYKRVSKECRLAVSAVIICAHFISR